MISTAARCDSNRKPSRSCKAVKSDAPANLTAWVGYEAHGINDLIEKGGVIRRDFLVNGSSTSYHCRVTPTFATMQRPQLSRPTTPSRNNKSRCAKSMEFVN